MIHRIDTFNKKVPPDDPKNELISVKNHSSITSANLGGWGDNRHADYSDKGGGVGVQNLAKSADVILERFLI